MTAESNKVDGNSRRDFFKVAAGAAAAGVTASMMTPSSVGAEVSTTPVGAAVEAAARPKGFLLPFAGTEDYETGRRFLDDPEGFLKEINMDPKDMVCPTEVHEAMQRSEAFAAEMEGEMAAGQKEPLELIELAKQIAPKHFGADYQVSVQPFGMKFKERIPLSTMSEPGTITGSFTITFYDKDTDVDS